MDRRGLLPFLLICALSGCASLKTFVSDGPGSAPVVVPKMTPAQSYDAGVLNMTRGDYSAARRDWERCLAMTTPESSLRGDCLAALEQLASTTALMP